MSKKPEIKFAPGAFDHFDGTQDELNSLMAEIKNMVESGKIFEESKPVNMDELQEEDPELYEVLMKQIDNLDLDNSAIDDNRKKKLN